MSALSENLKDYCRDHDMIQKGDRIIAGVSGGADSVCLFLLLLELREELSFDLSVIHVEHGIRGEESLADQAFVMNYCSEHDIPVCYTKVDVPAYAKEHLIGIEQAARELRYH